MASIEARKRAIERASTLVQEGLVIRRAAPFIQREQDPQERAEAERRKLVEGKLNEQEAEAYLSALERESLELADKEIKLCLDAAKTDTAELRQALKEAKTIIKSVSPEGERNGEWIPPRVYDDARIAAYSWIARWDHL